MPSNPGSKLAAGRRELWRGTTLAPASAEMGDAPHGTVKRAGMVPFPA